MDTFEVMHLEPRPFRPFKTSEEYLYAMKEDLAEWLQTLYGVHINVENFMEVLETGVVLCRHANIVLRKAREWKLAGKNGLILPDSAQLDRDVFYRTDVQPGTFLARDNVSNFIAWCRALAIKECLLFETDDLVMRKNERSFILCLLEVGRRGSKLGMLAPMLVQMEEEIEAELAKDCLEDSSEDSDEDFMRPQIITNDLRSLHERVVALLNRCSCPSQFPMIRVADGKYRIGDTKILIFVRILRNHVMVRVGGGWDTLGHYLDKHDPCRCRSGHRYSTSAKLTMTANGKAGSPQMQVTYTRPDTTTSPPNRRRSLTTPLGQECELPPSRNSHYSDDSSASSISTTMETVTDSGRTRQHPPTSTDSSSDLSENENKCATIVRSSVNGTTSLNTTANQSAGRGRKASASPRKMMKTNEGSQDGENWKCYSSNSPKSEQNGHHNQNNGSSPHSRDLTPSRIPTLRSPLLPHNGHNPNVSSPSLKRTSTAQNIHQHQQNNLGQSSSKSQSTEDLCASSRNWRTQQYPQLAHSVSSSPIRTNTTTTATSSPLMPRARRSSTTDSEYSSVRNHHGLPRSISQTAERSYGDESPFLGRGEPGRYSYRSPRASSAAPRLEATNRTWTFRQRNSRPGVDSDMFKASNGSRTPSPSKTPTMQRSPAKSKPAQQKNISPLLKEMLEDARLDSDEKILKKMELLVNQYRGKLDNGRNSPGICRQDSSSSDSQSLVNGAEDFVPDLAKMKCRRESTGSIGTSTSKIPLPTRFRRD